MTVVLQHGDKLLIEVAPPIKTRAIRIVFTPSGTKQLEFVAIVNDSGETIADDQFEWTADGEVEALNLTVVAPSGQLAFPLDAGNDFPGVWFTPHPDQTSPMTVGPESFLNPLSKEQVAALLPPQISAPINVHVDPRRAHAERQQALTPRDDLITTRLTRAEFDLITKYRKANEGTSE